MPKSSVQYDDGLLVIHVYGYPLFISLGDGNRWLPLLTLSLQERCKVDNLRLVRLLDVLRPCASRICSELLKPSVWFANSGVLQSFSCYLHNTSSRRLFRLSFFMFYLDFG
jgi:hypothetical protein